MGDTLTTWEPARWSVAVALAMVATFVVISVSAVGAATISVQCTSGAAGLIAAIEAANDETANPGPDTIELDADCVYTLTEVHNVTEGPNGLPVITSPLTIAGNNSTITRSTAPDTPDFRILYVNRTDLTVAGLIISNGSGSAETGAGGAGILNLFGNLTVTDSTIQHNSADFHGGGVYNQGTATLTNTVLAGNQTLGAFANGGGLWNGHTVTITESSVLDNTAGGGGGGLFNLSQMTVTRSLIHSNDALNGDGGGILFTPFSGQLMVEESTVSENTATGSDTTGNGGGIARTSSGGDVSISNSAIYGNTASREGGGLFTNTITTVTNVTFHN